MLNLVLTAHAHPATNKQRALLLLLLLKTSQAHQPLTRAHPAGVAVVNAHGQENAEAMLPLFESYLDKQVGAAGPALLHLPANVPVIAPEA